MSFAVSGCVKPKQTTAIGTATGGAIGAGLGAIIGNQTGNPSTGLTIGAVAGAATGALISNAIQEQQETTRAQDEQLKRHEETLKAQRSELAQLRNVQSDTGSPSARYVNAYLVEQNRLRLQKRGPSPKGETVSRFTPPPLATRASSEPLARFNVRTSPVAERQLREPEIKKAPVAAASAPQKKLIEEKDLASRAATTATATKAELAKAPTEAKEVVEKTITEPTQAKEEPQSEAKVVEQSDSNECAEAAKEREAGVAASEESEKLLHLKKALRLCPNSPETHHAMGTTYLSAGRVSDASFEFKEALKLNPSFEPAKESLKELDKDLEHF